MRSILPRVATILALLTVPGTAQRPFFFTQVHDGAAQSVSTGAAVRVQMPAKPALRNVVETSGNIT